MKTHLLAVLCSVVFLISGCGDEASGPERQVAQVVPDLRVGHVGHDHQLALYVAALAEADMLESRCGAHLRQVKEREVYDLVTGAQPVARLHFVKVGGGSRMPAAMERGEIDIGLGGVAPVVFFVDNGNDFKIVFPLQTDGDMLVVRSDFPAEDWESFVNHVKANDSVVKIGYKAPVAVAKLIFERALKAEGISIAREPGGSGGTIELVNLQGGPNMVPSLANGAVDGFVMNQPQVSVAVHKGVGKVLCDLSTLPPEGKWNRHPCCCVACPQKVIDDHREILKIFLKVLHASTDIINAHQDLASRYAAEWTKLPEEVERSSVPTVNYMNVATPAWIAGMETWAEMMTEIEKFTGTLKGKTPEEIVQLSCDLSLLEETL